ncbi:MAG: pyridoxal phosphate-dependent decarboxylase family protein [Allosphingosinicella sp.]|uniref:pyridoxal phosphate-dependent decarboxylase family protein n=1 Tax=Allosphingosinicella sp. TaxID=2823234 RepID=UPI00392BCA8A
MPDKPVAPQLTGPQIRDALQQFLNEGGSDLGEAGGKVVELLTQGNVQMMHPGYFGLFNPSPTFPGIVADLITATLNPQLATWSHAPAAVEIEAFTIAEVGGWIGWGADETAGHFTSGGSEANYTAVLAALTRSCPSFASKGARALTGQPRLYASMESHLAWLKIAHQAGIGRDAVCLVSTDGKGRMDVGQLEAMIENDRRAGEVPFLICATAGTTNAGMIDPLQVMSDVARRYSCWFHVDAAWGGAALIDPEMHAYFNGIAASDSVTIDAHKWLSVPMGAGMFLCRDNALLRRTFDVTASYMPAHAVEGVDPYTHSAQWSRRFIGLKLFLSLAVLGRSGYRDHIRRTCSLAEYLRRQLVADHWRILNESPLGVVCFAPPDDRIPLGDIAAAVVERGRSWISAARFEGKEVLRACITGHSSREAHVDRLIEDLRTARSDASA